MHSMGPILSVIKTCAFLVFDNTKDLKLEV